MTVCNICGNSGSAPDFIANHTCVSVSPFREETFTLEMWVVNPDGTMGSTFARKYPSVTRNGRNTRRHDALRDLASFALATHDFGRYYTRPARSDIRIDSVSRTARLVSDPARVAYFN